jgi:hypothetical protein
MHEQYQAYNYSGLINEFELVARHQSMKASQNLATEASLQARQRERDFFDYVEIEKLKARFGYN